MKNMDKKEVTMHTTLKRKSNLELYRIIVMLAIVAHHYVVNSGLMTLINEKSSQGLNSLFLLLFGCWGKIGINCFVLITGYYMCKSNISLRKFLKLFLEWMFYRVVIYAGFLISGYQSFSIKELVTVLIPYFSITDGFTACYTIFFLFIPFLNILIKGMNEYQHRMLIIALVCIFSIWASIPTVTVGSNYVFWFAVLYIVASYIRCYPIVLFENTKFWGWMSVLAVTCAYISIFAMVTMKRIFGFDLGGQYYFLSDCNKLTALAAAVCFFMFFKNLKLKYSKLINTVASSTFGVLCIHANSNTMRQWLWRDTFNNVKYFESPYLVIHAFLTVVFVFAVCVLIDKIRIQVVEKPFFQLYDRLSSSNAVTNES